MQLQGSFFHCGWLLAIFHLNLQFSVGKLSHTTFFTPLTRLISLVPPLAHIQAREHAAGRRVEQV
jgi:hypothetical protein